MDLLRAIGGTRLLGLAFAVIAILVILIFGVMKFSGPIMVPLYSNLSVEDSSMIISRLQAMNIPYESSSDGKQIMVPSKQVFSLRMSLAQEGIPHTGNIVGYEIFDKSEPLGSSQFVHNVNLVRALEGELSRTISSISQIDHARVHLVIPRKELFSKTGTEPSASVILKTRGGQNLSRDEIAAISYLVAHAVPGLNVEKVAIVDSLGRPLKIGSGEQPSATMSATSNEYQNNLEQKLENEITELVERSVGIGKAKVNVTAEIDFDREMVNTETFDPNGQVLRSRKVSEENDKERNSSESVSVSGNVPGSATSGGSGGKELSRSDEVLNYEISRTVSNKIIEGGHIKKLSIAILVDGMYESDKDGKTATYKERAPEELDKLKALVISAVGFDSARGDKIEIANLRFASEFVATHNSYGFVDWVKTDLRDAVQSVVIGIVMVLVVMLVIRPVVLKSLEIIKERHEYERRIREAAALAREKAEEKKREEGMDGLLADGNIADVVGGNEERRRSSMIRKLNELVDQSPEDAVAIIRNWLYQD
ncbi:MAG: flagellar M-ring protein FliF [Proteobacteria bacterium]|nr:flagellar M-ring protein FliF [Pseudomonadota bacterium]